MIAFKGNYHDDHDRIPSRCTKARPIKSHDRGGGAKTIPLVSPSIGATGFINGITEFGPSAAIAFHSHNCEESVMLLEGDAVLEMDGHDSVVLKKHDTTWLPANLSHRFRNLSDIADEDSLDICQRPSYSQTHRDRRDALCLCRAQGLRLCDGC